MGTTRGTGGREVALFATTGRAAAPDLTDKSPSEPRHTARPGTNNPAMDLFIVKTKLFYKNFLDRLYAVADLLTKPDPEPKPPDIDSDYRDDLQTLRLEIITGVVILTVSTQPTPVKKRTFDLFVKKRRKKFWLIICYFNQIDYCVNFLTNIFPIELA